MNHLLPGLKTLLFVVILCGSMETMEASETIPDTYECGAASSADYPNKPKVRLFYGESGKEHPMEHSMFFVNDSGQGYFSDIHAASKNHIEKIWGAEHKQGESFRLWGEYAFEKVERVRNPYYIDVRFRHEKLIAYRIRGPHISSPVWKKIEETEEKSN